MTALNCINSSNLKELCLKKIESSSLEELTNAINSTKTSFSVPRNAPNDNKVEYLINKSLGKRPQDLPKLLISTLQVKLQKANPQELKVFLKSFKKKFCQDKDKKYTQALHALFVSAMQWYTPDHFNLLKNIFETGIDPNMQIFILFDTKAPLLHHALRYKFPPFAIEYLLQNGAHCSSKNKAGDSSIHYFVKNVNLYNSSDAIEILHLLFRRKDFNSKGVSALELAYMVSSSRKMKNVASLLSIKKEMLKLLNYQDKAHSTQKMPSPFSLGTLIKRLSISDQPSGYQPMQNRTVFEQALIEEGKQNGEITFFKGTDVEIVSDENQGPLLLNQVTYSEAAACQALFGRIENGESCIQWENDKAFSEKVLSCLKKLLTRPSGRELIYSLVKSDRPLFIVENREDNASARPDKRGQLPELISVDLTQFRPVPCLNFNGEEVMQPNYDFLRLLHELLHARLINILSIEEAAQLLDMDSKNPQWSNLNEQFVITGLEGEEVLCENMLRFEFGELARCSHYSSFLSGQ
jgi:hypothetical protein